MAVATNPNVAYLSRATAWDYNAVYTCSLWLQPTAYVTSPYIFHIGDDADNNADLFLLEDSAGTRKVTAAVRVGGSTGAQAIQGSGIALNTWYHFALVRANTTTFYVYVNGSLLNTVTKDVTGRSALQHWYIGRAAGGSGNSGTVSVSHMKTWTAALTAAEIQNEMRTVRPQKLANLWAWWPILAGDRTRDYSGNGRTLTETGAVTDAADPGIAFGGLIWLVGNPTGPPTVALTATGITATPVLGQPALGQICALTALGITATPVLGKPSMAAIVALTAVGITATPVLGQPALAAIFALTALGITATPVLGQPVLGLFTGVLFAQDYFRVPAEERRMRIPFQGGRVKVRG